VFLRLMRSLRLGEASLWQEAPRALQHQVFDLELATPAGGGPSLTSWGDLVGSVASEYCHWVDHGRVTSPPRPDPEMIAGKDVLDLGCGFGRWLWEFQRLARTAIGIEPQGEYIALGEALARREGHRPPTIHCASAGDLRRLVPPASLDLISCRLVFNCVPIEETLLAAVTRLRPQGVLWIQVESFGQCCASLLKQRHLRSQALGAFAIVNSTLLVAANVQLALRSRGRMHSVHHWAYPTLGWWKRALGRAGLGDLHVDGRSGGVLSFWGRRTGVAEVRVSRSRRAYAAHASA
jgi:SAM-dependent methyltransferase